MEKAKELLKDAKVSLIAGLILSVVIMIYEKNTLVGVVLTPLRLLADGFTISGVLVCGFGMVARLTTQKKSGIGRLRKDFLAAAVDKKKEEAKSEIPAAEPVSEKSIRAAFFGGALILLCGIILSLLCVI